MDQPLRGRWLNATWAYKGCCELYVCPSRPIIFIPNSRIHLEWPDTYKLLPDALHPAHHIFSPSHPFIFVSLPYQRTNRYAVVSVIPLERIWVVASYMFSLAGLSYLSRTHAFTSNSPTLTSCCPMLYTPLITSFHLFTPSLFVSLPYQQENATR